jgi:membrane protein DedA with SNARE-associated domain
MKILLTLIGLITRHVLTLFAGIVIGGKVYLEAQDAASLLDAALLVIIAVVWSYSQKSKR